jgi:hypothetical protein
MAKFTEKICKNCIHWEKLERCVEYGLWIGGCPYKEILPYENSDCVKWEGNNGDN